MPNAITLIAPSLRWKISLHVDKENGKDWMDKSLTQVQFIHRAFDGNQSCDGDMRLFSFNGFQRLMCRRSQCLRHIEFSSNVRTVGQLKATLNFMKTTIAA